MLNSSDLYTWHDVVPIVVTLPAKPAAEPSTAQGQETPQSTTIGRSYLSYEVRRYSDLRNLRTSLAYQVRCTQRIVIPNSSPYSPGGDNPKIFKEYPAIVTNRITVDAKPDAEGRSAEVFSYHPRTLNSAVTTTHSDTASKTNSATTQHTSGSSTSQSNSFGSSASLGFFGDALTGDISSTSEHTRGSERSRSATTGQDSGSARESSSSDSMSVKDWACYSYLHELAARDPKVDPAVPGSSLTWTWGQEYPWNVLQYRGMGGTLPGFVTALLWDGAQVLPPSQLSQFGLDFTMKSVWLVRPPDGMATLIQSLSYYTATHQEGNATINYLGDFTHPSEPLDLCQYGLDPIVSEDGSPAAIIGFIPRQFLVPPSPVDENGKIGAPFRIISTSNNLLIDDTTSYRIRDLTPADKGAGFDAKETSLTATLSEHCPSLTMTVFFKVTDTDRPYKLFLKHWKAPDANGVRLTITVNGDDKNAISLYVDAPEAEGGESNLSSIMLRDLSYGSIDYHDYLSLGVNEIVITISPIKEGAPSGCAYQIRAISIERA